jgi:hypothetical protein
MKSPEYAVRTEMPGGARVPRPFCEAGEKPFDGGKTAHATDGRQDVDAVQPWAAPGLDQPAEVAGQIAGLVVVEDESGRVGNVDA